MQVAIFAALIIIALILLGLFVPILYGLVLAVFAAAPGLITVGVVFLAMLFGLIAYHAVRGDL